jgi:hypothetical protein
VQPASMRLCRLPPDLPCIVNILIGWQQALLQ